MNEFNWIEVKRIRRKARFSGESDSVLILLRGETTQLRKTVVVPDNLSIVREARRLCPEVQLVQAHHKLYVEYHHRIVTASDRHIPVEDVMSIDEVACRLDRKQQDPTVAQTLAHAIKHEIQHQVGECLTSSIGISANKLLAKMASDMQKPDGLTI